jgi:cytochrome b561
MTTSLDQSRSVDLNRREEQQTYDPIARALHWLVFGLVGLQVLVGWTMPDVRRNTPQEGLVDWHLSIGAVLMLVVVIRLLWRLIRPVPLMTGLAPWERKLAKLTHALLYVLLLVIPVLGWAAANYFGFTVTLFGALELPVIADNTMEWAHEAGDVHQALINVLIFLVGLHVLAALWHYFVRQDGVLQRMLPGIGKR